MSAVPGILSKRALTRATRLYDDEAYNKFTLQGLFGKEVVYSESEIEYEEEQLMRRLGTWHAAPATADRTSDAQYGLKRARALYQAQSFFLAPDELALFKEIGESKDLPLSVQDLLTKKERLIMRKLRQKVMRIRRTVENLLAQVLSVGSATVTVDGVTQNLNYGVNTKTAAATWATASTNIIEEFVGWIADFVEFAGTLPTHFVVSHRFWSSYIAKNDDLREFDIRNSLTPMNKILEAALDMSEAGIKWVTITDRYLDGSDTAQQHWATDKLTMLAMDVEDDFELATVRTLDNDLNGGLFTYEVMHPNPRQLEIITTHNCVPILRNPQKVMICDLVP